MNTDVMKKYFITFIKSNIHVFLLLSIFGTIGSFFSKYNFIFDICSQFKIQYILCALISLLLYFIFKIKEKKHIIVAIVIIVINLIPVVKNLNLNISLEKSDFRVGVINVLTQNKQYNKVINDIIKNSPDILVLIEIDEIWSSKLDSIKNKYPYKYEVHREDNFGMALYSNIPIIKVRRLNAGNLGLPVISVLCHKKGLTFEVIAVHTTPPINQEYFKNTRQMIENISAYIESTQLQTIVAGDLNTSFFSYNYKNLLKTAKLKDSGGILKPTWAAFSPLPFRISLDHIFVTKAFKVKNFKRGKKVGSDHFPVYADLIIKN